MYGPNDDDDADSLAAWLERAERLEAIGQREAARAAFQAAVRRDAGYTARIRFGCFLARIESHAEAAQVFAGLSETARRNGHRRIESLACHDLAAVYREGNRPAEAAFWQQRALAAAMDATDSLTADIGPDLLSGLAHDALQRGELALAEDLWTRSLRQETECGALDGQAADWGNLGVVRWLRGDLPTAVEALGIAYALHRRVGDRRGMGTDLLNLGQLCAAAGHWREAVFLLRRATRLLRRAPAAQLAARAERFLHEAIQVDGVRRREPRWN